MHDELRAAYSRLGRYRASRRPRVPITCTLCGASKTTYPRSLYCGNACKQRAKYARAQLLRARAQLVTVLTAAVRRHLVAHLTAVLAHSRSL